MCPPVQPATGADRLAVVAALREIGQLLALDKGERYRARAYERGARALESVEIDLGTLAVAGALTSIPGVGAGLAKTITELVATGRSTVLDGLRARVPAGTAALGRVLSAPKVRAVHEALGVTSLAGLREACVAGRVRRLSGFGEKTERHLLERIDALTDDVAAVLLPEAERQAGVVVEHLARAPGVLRIEIAGALRRRTETIDRLDLVVAARDPARVLLHATALPSAITAERGDGAVLLRRPAALDTQVHATTRPGLVASWFRATGSPGHVDLVLARATSPDGAADEAELYARAGLPFIPPELREDAGEIDAAVAGTLPRDLVELRDLRGAVHCHTVASDGRNTIEEMATAAEALGLDYLTITDHSPSATYANGLDLERLKRQWDEIARVQDRVRVRLLRGTETDILRDRALDHPDAVLERLDVVIASIHNRHGLDADAMTRRLVRALRHPRFKIWGHALGRYVLSRPPFACHVERVLDAIAESRAAIEVNGDPHRLDLAPPWLRKASQRGIRFVVSSDAHSTTGLANMRFGIDMARRGWIRRAEVLNTLPPDRFADAVRP